MIGCWTKSSTKQQQQPKSSTVKVIESPDTNLSQSQEFEYMLLKYPDVDIKEIVAL